MWKAHIEELNAGRIERVSLLRDNIALSYAEVLQHWRHDTAFRTFFIQLLANGPFPACFWETPPITRMSVNKAFEFVLVNSSVLAGVEADRDTFAGHFAVADAEQTVVGFTNLSNDAFLIAPCPLGSVAAYPHLAAFARRAPESQQHALWRRVGDAVVQRLSDRPLWISTSGLGVYWLHVRLDTCPKYYTYPPYTQFTDPGR